MATGSNNVFNLLAVFVCGLYCTTRLMRQGSRVPNHGDEISPHGHGTTNSLCHSDEIRVVPVTADGHRVVSASAAMDGNTSKWGVGDV